MVKHIWFYQIKIVGSRSSGWAQQQTRIQAQRTQYNEFVESGSKSWALMGQWLVWKLGMIKQELRIEPDGPTSRGKGLLIREYEFPPSLPPLWEISDIIYLFLWFILLLHLLVIHAHTWVHVLSAAPSDALWAVVAPIALSRGHVHINGVRALAVGI